MSIKIGSTSYSDVYLGSTGIQKAYLGSTLVYNKDVTPPFPTTNLQSYWRLDETSGTAVADAVGSLNGTASNVTWTSGKINNGGSFSSASKSLINFGNVNNVGTSNHTWSCWFRINDTGNWRGIITKQYADVNGYVLLISNVNKIRYSLVQSGNWRDVESNTTVSANTWYHVVVFRNGNSLSMYVNGVLDKTQSITAVNPDNTQQLRFGRLRSSADAEYWNGLIDEVGFWNRALAPEEIQTLYNNGIGLSI